METKLGRERRVDEGICGAVRVKAHLHLTHSREGTRRQVAYLQCPWRPRPLECRMRQSRHCKDTETWGMIFFFFFASLPLHHLPGPASPHNPATSPAHQSKRPGPKAVHENSQRQCGSTQQEGANGETQVEHLFLLVTACPLMLFILGGIGPVLS